MVSVPHTANVWGRSRLWVKAAAPGRFCPLTATLCATAANEPYTEHFLHPITQQRSIPGSLCRY